MRAKKGVLSRANVAHATGKGKRIAERTLLAAHKFSTDEDRTERISKSLCLCCFYIFKERMRILRHRNDIFVDGHRFALLSLRDN